MNTFFKQISKSAFQTGDLDNKLLADWLEEISGRTSHLSVEILIEALRFFNDQFSIGVSTVEELYLEIGKRKQTMRKDTQIEFLRLNLNTARKTWVKIAGDVIKQMQGQFETFSLEDLLVTRYALLRVCEFKNVKLPNDYQVLAHLLDEEVGRLELGKKSLELRDYNSLKLFVDLLKEGVRANDYWQNYFEQNADVYLFPKTGVLTKKGCIIGFLQGMIELFGFQSPVLLQKVGLLDFGSCFGRQQRV